MIPIVLIPEYKDDVFVIPRNTSIIVRRLPASRPGKGTAQRYVLGALPADGKGGMGSGSPAGMMKTGPPGGGPERYGGRNMSLNYKQQRVQQQEQAPAATQSSSQESSTEPPSASVTTGNDSEDAAIQAMFQQTTDQWGAMQEKLAE